MASSKVMDPSLSPPGLTVSNHRLWALMQADGREGETATVVDQLIGAGGSES